MNQKIVIRKADRRHLRGINHLIRETNIGSPMEQIEEGNFWFVRMDDRIVGYVGLEFIDGKTVLLKHLAVQKEYRKKGIGVTLFDHAVQFARSRGATTAAFVTMYYHFNRFKRRGFKTCPRRFLPENVRNNWMFTAKRYMKCAAMIREFSAAD